MTLREGKTCVYILLHLYGAINIACTETIQGSTVGYKIMAHGVLAAIRGLIVKTR